MFFTIFCVLIILGVIKYCSYCRNNVKFLDFCHLGDEYKVRELLHKNIDINVQEENGLTPLIVAAQAGHIEIVKILLEAGANPYITDNRGFSAEHHAISYGNVEIAELIYSYKKKR
ncbi:MAG: ankyrin repeat domain-containing protein [Elusimicrobiaceae bacterium]|nr:ankyrin repeat domain-containing protein [Elusimicrobiaceae bacterium]